MELRDVEYFAAVAEHLNVGRAAEALGMSQSALSKCLRRLEASIGAKIVKRTPKGVELTGVGSAVLAQIQRLRLAHDDVMREVAELSEGHAGHLRIGVAQGLQEYLLGTAIGLLLKEARNATIEVEVVKTDEMLAALRLGRFDFAVSTAEAVPSMDLEQLHLLDDQFAVFAPAHHPLAMRKRVKLVDLSGQRWAKTAANRFSWDVLSRLFRANGLLPPAITLEANSAAVRFQAMMASNLLYFSSHPFMKRAAAGFRFKALDLKELTWTRRVNVFYRKDGYLSPVARRLIELLKTTAGEIVKEG
jgi:DNA-binding transcriptional LysR family regulator